MPENTPKDHALAALRYEWRAHRSLWLGGALAVTLLGVLYGALAGEFLRGLLLGLGAVAFLYALLLAFLAYSLARGFPKGEGRAAVTALLPLLLLFAALAMLLFSLA